MALKIFNPDKEYFTELQEIQKTFKKTVVHVAQPKSEFPELVVTVPDSWSTIQLAPLYDVHIGNTQHDSGLLAKHLKWIAETPNVLTWNGGDMIENITPQQAKMGHTTLSPQEQIELATKTLAPVRHKTLFSLPGNHEARTFKGSQISSGKMLADNLQLPYFMDYCFMSIKWRGQNFRIIAHHGAGGAQTAGAQLNSARKDLAWTSADLIWTGHLHQNKVDVVYRIDHDQKTGRAFERDTIVIISPSYLNYFGGYAAASRMPPGVRGLSVAVLNPDGRIDASMHARGKRI
jgi:hypothetical protein